MVSQSVRKSGQNSEFWTWYNLLPCIQAHK
jgi:hypothetical protein